MNSIIEILEKTGNHDLALKTAQYILEAFNIAIQGCSPDAQSVFSGQSIRF